MTWTSINKKLPPTGKRVKLKRDFSVGIGGTNWEGFVWESSGFMHSIRPNGKISWCVNKADGVTLDNAEPTHWKEVRL